MTERVRYTPFITDGSTGSQDYQSHNFVPADIAIEQQKAFGDIAQWIAERSCLTPYEWLKSQLKIRHDEDFNKMLTFEQMDAVLMAIYNLDKGYPNSDFIIADTMGNGKGRILASIARYAFVNHRNVMFFTITDGLFSAFYEDLKSVGALQFLNSDIFIMHGTGRIYDGMDLVQKSLGNESLNAIYKSGKPVVFKNDKSGKPTRQVVGTDLLMSTYSQLSSETSFQGKYNFLKHVVNQDTIFLFDEFHKSIGESQTKDSREQIMKLGGSSIRSSATFFTKYEHLYSYLSLFELDYFQDQLAISAFKHNTDLQLNANIGRLLTQKGQMIRRENERTTEIPYIEMSEELRLVLEDQLSKVRKIFYKMFECFHVLKNQNKMWQTKWTAFGGLIVRLNNILILHGKKQFLIERIEDALNKNQKVLVVLESTFSSNIEQAIQLQHELEHLDDSKATIKMDTPYKKLDYSSLLTSAMLNLFAFAYEEDNQEFNRLYDETMDLIDDFPEIPLSFIDEVMDHFEHQGLNVLEISGRKFRVKKDSVTLDKQGNTETVYRLYSKPKEEKAIIAHKFNNGWIDPKTKQTKQADIIFLTLSGFTGISLHAHYSYADQRQRKMLEIQSTNKEMEREQATKRHDRMGQTSVPEIEGLLSGILFEKRQIALNDNKANRMRSLTSHVHKEYDSIYNPLSNRAVLQFMLENSNYAKYIGIYTDTINVEPMFYLDTMLKRSLLFSNGVQKHLNDLVSMATDTYTLCEHDYQNKMVASFIHEVKIADMKEVWRHPTANKKKIELIDELSKDAVHNTLLPVIYQANVHNSIALEHNDVKAMRNDLMLHYQDFQAWKLNYIAGINGISVLPELYDDIDNVLKARQVLAHLSVGHQIVFHYNGNLIYGYINQITMDEQFTQYPMAYCYEIVLINPTLNKHDNRVCTDRIWVHADVLLKGQIKHIDKKIDWEKYSRNGERVHQEGIFLLGNMFYLNLFNQVMGLGQSLTLSKQNGTGLPDFIYAIRLPNRTTQQQVNELLNKDKLIMDAVHAISNISRGRIVSYDNRIMAMFDSNVKSNGGVSIGHLFAIDKSMIDNEEIDSHLKMLLGKDVNYQMKTTPAVKALLKEYPVSDYHFYKVCDKKAYMKLWYNMLSNVKPDTPNRFFRLEERN